MWSFASVGIAPNFEPTPDVFLLVLHSLPQKFHQITPNNLLKKAARFDRYPGLSLSLFVRDRSGQFATSFGANVRFSPPEWSSTFATEI